MFINGNLQVTGSASGKTPTRPFEFATKNYADNVYNSDESCGISTYLLQLQTTNVTAQVAGTGTRPNVTVPFTAFPVMGRKHYVKWSITVENGVRWGTLTLTSPSAANYGIAVSLFYPPTLSGGSNIWTQTVTSYGKLLSNGDYYANNGESIVIRIDQGTGGLSMQTVFGIFAYEIVPSLLAFNL